MTIVGLALPQLGPHVTRDVLETFCVRAEDLGYGSLWAQDHFAFVRQPEGGYAGIPGAPMPDAYRQSMTPLELLSFAAAWTSRVRIGTSVLVAGHHRPAPLAKQLATLDVLSSGRLTVGLGVGWFREEQRLSGVDPATRGARMDDFVPALLACWEPGVVSYRGAFFDIPEMEMAPRPVQSPRPPLIAGMWSRAGRRRTVTMFDGWNPAGMPIDRVVRASQELQARRAGGLPRLTVHARIFVVDPRSTAVDPQQALARVVDEVARAAVAGIDEVIVDASFWTEIDRPEGWAALPDRLRPALDAVARTPSRLDLDKSAP